MNSKIFQNRIFLTIFISSFIFFLILLVRWPFYIINEKLKSYIINKKNHIYLSDSAKVNNLINDDIVVLTFDEKSLDKLWFPISRREYKPIIENLNSAWASIIAFDIIFANNNNLDIEWDNILSESIKNAWNVVLWWALISKKFESWETLQIIEKPLDKFLSWALSFWYYQPNVDLKSNIVTSFRPSAELYDINKDLFTYNHFSISVLKSYYSKIYNKDFISYENKDNDFYYLRPDYKIPFLLSWHKDILINFVPLPSFSENKYSKFPSYSFIDIYEWNFDPSAFKWKIVLIWATAKWLKDIFNTPNGSEYWVYVLANIINTISKASEWKSNVVWNNWSANWWFISICRLIQMLMSSSDICVLSWET